MCFKVLTTLSTGKSNPDAPISVTSISPTSLLEADGFSLLIWTGSKERKRQKIKY